MPIPAILIGAAFVTAATGFGAGAYGVKKMYDAHELMKLAKSQHDDHIKQYKLTQDTTNDTMDKLGKLELEILNSFEHFCDLISKIQNRPIFENFSFNADLPKYNPKELKDVSVGAGVILGGTGGLAAGVLGGYAAAGATTAAVMALGAASTGTAISSLSGIAATNAIYALLGGGTLAAGGGGVALGTTVLSTASLGVGFMIGGVILAYTGSKLSDKAEEAWDQMLRAQKAIDEICAFLNQLTKVAGNYKDTLVTLKFIYDQYLQTTEEILAENVDWNQFTDQMQKTIENLVHLTILLYAMCKENLVIQSTTEGDPNKVNTEGVEKQKQNAEDFIKKIY